MLLSYSFAVLLPWKVLLSYAIAVLSSLGKLLSHTLSVLSPLNVVLSYAFAVLSSLMKLLSHAFSVLSPRKVHLRHPASCVFTMFLHDLILLIVHFEYLLSPRYDFTIFQCSFHLLSYERDAST